MFEGISTAAVLIVYADPRSGIRAVNATISNKSHTGLQPHLLKDKTALSVLQLRDFRWTSTDLTWVTTLTGLLEFRIGAPGDFDACQDCSSSHHMNSLAPLNPNSVVLPHDFAKMTALFVLGLERVGMHSVPPEIFDMPIMKLYLEGNEFTTIPSLIGKMTALQYLESHDSRISRLPAEIGNLRSLNFLNIRNNALTSVPAELFTLTALTQLLMIMNPIARIPPEIGRLSALKVLQFGSSGLSRVPRGLFKLTKLTHLELSSEFIGTATDLSESRTLHSRTQITHIPTEISELTELRGLVLNGNQLADLPTTMGQLGKLTRLSLGTNRLTDIPPWLSNLSQLRYLNLIANALTRCPESVARLPNLEIVNFWNNSIASCEAVAVDTDVMVAAGTKVVEGRTNETLVILDHNPVCFSGGMSALETRWFPTCYATCADGCYETIKPWTRESQRILGNSECDVQCNVPECAYDHGDCAVFN